MPNLSQPLEKARKFCIFFQNSIPSAAVEDGAESSQHCKRQQRADIQGVEDWRNYVAEEVQVRVAEVANGRQGLAVPGNVWEPTEQDPDHQNSAVDVEPLGEPGRHHRQRRVQVPTGPVLQRREEQRARACQGRSQSLGQRIEDRTGEIANG